MSPALFSTLPDAARLWLLALTQAVDPAMLAPEIDALLGKWRHKGTQYQADWALLEGRILAIAEPTLAEQPSGCAIDGMQRGLGQALGRLELRLEDPQAVLVRLPDGLRTLPRADLAAHLADGTLTATTPVVDLALLTLGDFRQGRFERPLGETWIGRKFGVKG
ncbi:MAG: hypothetical protein WCO20_01725 [Holophagaceae bacterium]